MTLMKRKNYVLLVGGIVSFVVTYVFLPTTEKTSHAVTNRTFETHDQPTSEENSKDESSFTTNAQGEQFGQMHNETENAIHPLSAPSMDQVRQEVADNPHRTPISIIDFAAKLGTQMERALESEEIALSLFDELKKCALNSSLPTSIQTICLSNAQILKNIHSKLEVEYVSLKEQVSPEAVRLLTDQD
jgi:hypothetical protein